MLCTNFTFQKIFQKFTGEMNGEPDLAMRGGVALHTGFICVCVRALCVGETIRRTRRAQSRAKHRLKCYFSMKKTHFGKISLKTGIFPTFQASGEHKAKTFF